MNEVRYVREGDVTKKQPYDELVLNALYEGDMPTHK